MGLAGKIYMVIMSTMIFIFLTGSITLLIKMGGIDGCSVVTGIIIMLIISYVICKICYPSIEKK